ncbi:OmpH family outer membrane protein, partial [Sphingomonas bacterium]|uniref:OmpH family outer membrane protein n=1 Tax=Sphingomonas bacterium TaxID=1895847 RepID=UPI00157619BE
MLKLARFLAAAAIAAPGALLTAAPVQAQVGQVATADPQAAMANTKAFQAAVAQIRVTYKAQIDQAQARGTAIDAELQPLVTQFNAARAVPNANQQALQTQLQAIQAKQNAGRDEIARITAPAERAQQYALEQLQQHLSDAVQAVVKARNIGLIVSPQAVLLNQPAADVTPAITTELDRLVPTVSTAVPANWQPGQQQQAGAAPAPA